MIKRKSLFTIGAVLLAFALIIFYEDKLHLIVQVKVLAEKVIGWANQNEGFLALIALGGSIVVWLLTRRRRSQKAGPSLENSANDVPAKPDVQKPGNAGTAENYREDEFETEPEPALEPASADGNETPMNIEQRYLEHLIETHQLLPVMGFETNLRIPIPLEKVYVTLRAQLTDWERARGSKEKALTVQEAPPDRDVTAQEALTLALEKKYHGVVILGHPGSGKTTLAKYFALCFAAGKAQENLGLDQILLPILLFLREVRPEKSLAQNILLSLHKYALGLNENFFISCLRKGEAIILLDGLDEVPTEAKRAAVSQWIQEKVHKPFPKCPLVVTSRFSGYRGEAVLPGFYLRLDIQDFELEQVRQFIRNWLTAVETHLNKDTEHWRSRARIAADDLYRRIEENPTLRDLAVNPLMLQIIALVHRDRGTLPERRVELYKECTDVLLERWDKAKGLQVPLSAAQARQLLQPVALWMHSVENRREVSKAEVLDFIAPRVPQIKPGIEAEALLQSWQERSGIFKGEGDAYFFHHLSFQEYLTAEQIRNTRHQAWPNSLTRPGGGNPPCWPWVSPTRPFSAILCAPCCAIPGATGQRQISCSAVSMKRW